MWKSTKLWKSTQGKLSSESQFPSCLQSFRECYLSLRFFRLYVVFTAVTWKTSRPGSTVTWGMPAKFFTQRRCRLGEGERAFPKRMEQKESGWPSEWVGLEGTDERRLASALSGPLQFGCRLLAVATRDLPPHAVLRVSSAEEQPGFPQVDAFGQCCRWPGTCQHRRSSFLSPGERPPSTACEPYRHQCTSLRGSTPSGRPSSSRARSWGSSSSAWVAMLGKVTL